MRTRRLALTAGITGLVLGAVSVLANWSNSTTRDAAAITTFVTVMLLLAVSDHLQRGRS